MTENTPYRLQSRNGFCTMGSRAHSMMSSFRDVQEEVTDRDSSSNADSELEIEGKIALEDRKSVTKDKSLPHIMYERKRKKKKQKNSNKLQPINESDEQSSNTNEAKDKNKLMKLAKDYTLPMILTLPKLSSKYGQFSDGDDSMSKNEKFQAITGRSSHNGKEIKDKKEADHKYFQDENNVDNERVNDPDTGTGNCAPWLKRGKDVYNADCDDSPRFMLDLRLHSLLLPNVQAQAEDAEEGSTPKSDTTSTSDTISQDKELDTTTLPQLCANYLKCDDDILSDTPKTWQSLPMASELETYVNRMKRTKHRNAGFSKSLNLPTFGNSLGLLNRPHTHRPSLMERQKTRFGGQMLKDNMQEARQGTLTENIYNQQQRTYALHTRVKTILQDGIVKHA